MLTTAKSQDPELIRHLDKEFGDHKICCYVPRPPDGSVVQVMEPILAADPNWGSGLDENHCIPRGVYRIDSVRGGTDSHRMLLYNIENGALIEWIYGWGINGDMTDWGTGAVVDWKGVRKYTSPTQQSP